MSGIKQKDFSGEMAENLAKNHFSVWKVLKSWHNQTVCVEGNEKISYSRKFYNSYTDHLSKKCTLYCERSVNYVHIKFTFRVSPIAQKMSVKDERRLYMPKKYNTPKRKSV